MKKILPIIIIVAVGIGGYFGLKSAGFLKSDLTKDEIHTALVAWADEINAADGGLPYGNASILTSAEVIHVTIHLKGKSNYNASDLGDGFLESQKMMAIAAICNNEDSAAWAAGFAAFNFVWTSNDDVKMGNFKLRHKRLCEG